MACKYCKLPPYFSPSQTKRLHSFTSDCAKTFQKVSFTSEKKLYNFEHLPCTRRNIRIFNRFYSTDKNQSQDIINYLDVKDKRLREILASDMIVKSDFISESEEESLLAEVDKYMRRLRYEFDHWDNAIHGYRETEKKEWNEKNMQILERVRGLAFTSDVSPLAYVHVLDIAKDGYIKPHVDAVRFCGDTITGMCLLSPCVMRLALESNSRKYGDVYLPRRSLYIMRGQARYKFTHEVLKNEESYFREEHVPRDRRISIICRNEPSLKLS